MTFDLRQIINDAKAPSDNSKYNALEPDFKDHLLIFQEWLLQHYYTDIDVLAFGTTGVVFSSASNPDIVIRMSTDQEPSRKVLPQMVQPIFSMLIMRRSLEILPKLETKNVTPKHYTAFNNEMTLAYADEQDTLKRGYEIRDSHINGNIGLFHYRDKQNRKKTVAMAYDPGTIGKVVVSRIEQDGKVYETDTRPKCTENYPTLQDQRRRQLEIIGGDERLQALVGKQGELLEPYPETVIVPSQQPSQQAL